MIVRCSFVAAADGPRPSARFFAVPAFYERDHSDTCGATQKRRKCGLIASEKI
jgi:hypothetical protein